MASEEMLVESVIKWANPKGAAAAAAVMVSG